MTDTHGHLEHKGILDNLLEGCQVIDRYYRYAYVNKAVAAQGHSTVEQLMGRKMSEVYPGIENTEVFARIQAAMEHGTSYQMENEFIYPNGQKGWFELRIEQIPEGVFILSLDITDKKLAERRLKQLNEMKDMFIRIVSKQLRKPLEVVRWGLEEMLKNEQGPLNDAQLEVVKLAQKANSDVIRRINDLISAIDIEESRITIQKTSGNIEQLLRKVIGRKEDAFRNKGIALNVSYPDQPLEDSLIDITRIDESFTKVIENAYLYTPSKGIVSISLIKLNGHGVRLEVKDTGIGIPEDDQEFIFERFFRASNAATMHEEASGVGLYLAKHYIEQHEGRIGFESKEGSGSTFWIELPIVKI